ncbi:CLUMA_CG001776, isoform A [Clunio marinus]|uniref:CLUMA_CG001776, isoform A n=1 Tax=Clunio marinus TaxID=568069 RepID=A0A1J1HNE2_9DIPT|nr:CLUMA_CG001776, isoform A [Clunio marinus]
MDQTPKSTDQRRTDQNNNNKEISNVNLCSCTNISIMQLFHEMKQEFPKLPDHTIHQHVTDNCHNRRACIDQLHKALITTIPTTTMYPSKSIHSNQQIPRSPVAGTKWANNQKMKEISEMFENSSSEASSSSDGKLKRPTTLRLRRAPDPPNSASASNSSTPTSTSKLTSSTSTSSLVASTTSSVSSMSSASATNYPNSQNADSFSNNHHVALDSSASKYNDSLNVQLNVTVSPISSTAPTIPPRPPTRPARHISQLKVQPEPAFTSILEPKKSPNGGASIATGTAGQRSYTSVNFTLRQPTSILPSAQSPIEIQAGPSSLTYSSSSFDARQGYQSHLKITVAGNGESCVQAVRTKQPSSLNSTLPEVDQIDTTISIGGKNEMNDSEPIKITTNNKQILPPTHHRMTENELHQMIEKQIKQKELLECELTKEREKLKIVQFDIITLTSPMMTQSELQQLCDEISRLRSACNGIADEIDVVTAPPPSPAVSLSPSRPQRPPPPIPAALRCLSLHQSPFHSQIQPFESPRIHYPAQPPSYTDVLREMGRTPGVTANNNSNSLPNFVEDVNEGEWSCSMCTFLNYPLLNNCEQCDMPRVQGIRITSSSYRPLRQNNNLQGASVATNHDNANVVQATVL